VRDLGTRRCQVSLLGIGEGFEIWRIEIGELIVDEQMEGAVK
jgi:hypothetical protein